MEVTGQQPGHEYSFITDLDAYKRESESIGIKQAESIPQQSSPA